MKVLMVLTSHDQSGNTGRKTGFWLEELAAPYFGQSPHSSGPAAKTLLATLMQMPGPAPSARAS